MKVGLLTEEQKNQLIGQLYEPRSYFNPTLDGNNPPNWIISTEEMEYNINPDFIWVKDLPLIDWVSPISPSPENHFSQFFG